MVLHTELIKNGYVKLTGFGDNSILEALESEVGKFGCPNHKTS